MKKMNFTSKQTAFEYALYMIASSYFEKTNCKSTLVERSLLLQYKEQTNATQYQMEDICIGYMDELFAQLPREIFQQKMQVYFHKNVNTGTTEILFANQQYIVGFQSEYAGRKTEIYEKVWKKE